MSVSDVIVFSADLSRFRPPITGIPGQSRGLFRKAKTLVLAYFAGGFAAEGTFYGLGVVLSCRLNGGASPS